MYNLFCFIFWKILFHFHPKGAPLIQHRRCNVPMALGENCTLYMKRDCTYFLLSPLFAIV